MGVARPLVCRSPHKIEAVGIGVYQILTVVVVAPFHNRRNVMLHTPERYA